MGFVRGFLVLTVKKVIASASAWNAPWSWMAANAIAARNNRARI